MDLQSVFQYHLLIFHQNLLSHLHLIQESCRLSHHQIQRHRLVVLFQLDHLAFLLLGLLQPGLLLQVRLPQQALLLQGIPDPPKFLLELLLHQTMHDLVGMFLMNNHYQCNHHCMYIDRQLIHYTYQQVNRTLHHRIH